MKMPGLVNLVRNNIILICFVTLLIIYGVGFVFNVPIPILGTMHLSVLLAIITISNINDIAKKYFTFLIANIIASFLLTIIFMVKYYVFNIRVTIITIFILYGGATLIALIVTKFKNLK